MFALIALSVLAAATAPVQVVLALGATCLLGWVTVRCFRAAVLVDDRHVVRRGYLRTTRVALDDIAEVRVFPKGIWTIAALRTRGGEWIELDEAAQLRTDRGPVTELIAALAELRPELR